MAKFWNEGGTFTVLRPFGPVSDAAKSGAVNSEQASDIGGGSAGSEYVHNYIRQGRIGLSSGWGRNDTFSYPT